MAGGRHKDCRPSPWVRQQDQLRHREALRKLLKNQGARAQEGRIETPCMLHNILLKIYTITKYYCCKALHLYSTLRKDKSAIRLTWTQRQTTTRYRWILFGKVIALIYCAGQTSISSHHERGWTSHRRYSLFSSLLLPDTNFYLAHEKAKTELENGPEAKKKQLTDNEKRAGQKVTWILLRACWSVFAFVCSGRI